MTEIDQLLAHAAGDYLVQNSWMANNKPHHWLPAIVHAATYTACFLPVTRNPRAIAAIGISHLLIDHYRPVPRVAWARNQIAPRADRYSFDTSTMGYADGTPPWLAGWLNIIADNTAHLILNRMAIRRWGRK